MGQFLDLVIHQRDIRRVHGDVAANAAHGNAHIRLFQSRSVVDAVTDHAHRKFLGLIFTDVLQLILRQAVCPDFSDMQLFRNGFGGVFMVAGHHRLIDRVLAGENDPVHRNALAGKHTDPVADLNLFGGNDFFHAIPQDPGRLGCQVNQLFNPGSGLCHRQFLQQSAQLHDKGHLAGGKDLSDADRRDQCQGNQHIRLDVKSRDQSNDRLQNDGDAAQNNGDPGHVKGKRLDFQQTANDCDAGDHQECDILFDAAQFQQMLQPFHEMFHTLPLFYTLGGMRILYLWGYMLSSGKRKKSALWADFQKSDALLHIGKAFHCFGELFNGLVRVAVFDAVPDAMLDMSLQHHFAAAVQGRTRSVDLRENVLARNILVDHPVNGLNLTDDLFQAAMQVF